VTVALVFVIARLLTAGSPEETPAAEQVGSRLSDAGDGQAGASGEAATDGTGPDGGEASPDAAGPTVPATPTLAEPEGECAAEDVVVTPSVAAGALAGRDVPITLALQTRAAEACTWQVSAGTVVVKVAREGKDVWTTRQCPQAITDQPVVVRRAVTTTVQVVWAEARESAEGCTRRAGWVRPGDFTVAAAALGGEPAEAEFALGAPAPETIQVTPKAKNTEQVEKPTKPTN